MAITNNSLFKVVLIPDATYQTLVSGNNDVRATAYFAYDTKKIYVDRVAYGFNSSDVTAAILADLIKVDTGLSIIATSYLTNTGDIALSFSVRLAHHGAKTWVYTSTGDSAATTVTSAGSFEHPDEFILALETEFPVSGRTVGHTAKGAVTGSSPAKYFFAEVKANGSDENLIQMTTNGLQVLKSDVQAMIDISVEGLKDELNLEGRLENKTGCYIVSTGAFDATITDESTCNATPDRQWLRGIPTLDTGGKIPAAQLPGYVDDVIEVAAKPTALQFASNWFARRSGCYIAGVYDPTIGTSGACSTAGGTWYTGYTDTPITPALNKMYSLVEYFSTTACYIGGVLDDTKVDQSSCEIAGGTWYIRDAVYSNATFRWSGSAYFQIANPNLKSLKLGKEQSGEVIQYDIESLLGSGEVTIDQHVRWTVVTPTP